MAYGAENDPYCYAGTSILKNIPGFRDQAALDEFEKALVRQRSLEILPQGRLTVRHYRAIHHHLFQDVYRWAGNFRKVRIHKGASTFCYPEHINAQMKQLFTDLKQADYYAGLGKEAFAASAAHFLATLNAVHPYREGNGRAQNSFLGLLAVRAGHPLDLARMHVEAFRAAMIESFGGSEGPLAEEIEKLVET